MTASGLVRPLIDVERCEVRSWLRDRGIAWREDSSNRNPAFARNRIRHELLPKLSGDWNPALEATLARTADWALAEESYWHEEIGRLAEALFTRRGGSVVVRADRLAALPLAAARRLAQARRGRGEGRFARYRFRAHSGGGGFGRRLPKATDG